MLSLPTYQNNLINIKMNIKVISLIFLSFESLVMLGFYSTQIEDLSILVQILQFTLQGIGVVLQVCLIVVENRYNILKNPIVLGFYNLLTFIQLIQLMEFIALINSEISVQIVILHMIIIYEIDNVLLNFRILSLIRWAYVLIRILIIFPLSKQSIFPTIQIILISIFQIRQNIYLRVVNYYQQSEEAKYDGMNKSKKPFKLAKTLDSLTSPNRDQNEYRIIDKFPEGVALVAFQDPEPNVIYCNEVMKQLLKVDRKDEVLEGIRRLTGLEQVQKNEEVIIRSSSYKSFSLEQQNEMDANLLVRGNRAVTNEMFLFRQWTRTDDHNPFFRVMISAKRQLLRCDLSVFNGSEASYELFATLNGYQNVKKDDLIYKNRCIEIKIFLTYSLKNSQILILARDVSHRDFIKLLQESNKEKQNSLNFVSHEFRTPLNCIITMLESCEEENIVGVKHLKTAIQNCYYLLNLSNDLLDLAQMKVGKFKLVKHQFNFLNLLKQCIQMFSVMASQKQIVLDLKFENNLPKNIKTDENRIKQVLVNLLGNAFKFTLKGSIQIQVEMIHNETLRVSVTDTGIGIKEEDKGNLLIAFGKSESDENKKLNRQGVGLGLLISNMIARNLNKSNIGLQFSSTYGHGSSFYFDIDFEMEPFILEPLNSIGNQHESGQKIGSFEQFTDQEKIQRVYTAVYQRRDSSMKQKLKKTCSCRTILIVDDVQFNIEALILILSKRIPEKKIDFVISGEMAVEAVKKKLESNCCKKYQLIFMDIEMPGMDGFDTFKQINSFFLNKGLRVAVVACSGYSSEKEKSKALKLEMDDYLEKPLKRSEVERIVKSYLLDQ